MRIIAKPANKLAIDTITETLTRAVTVMSYSTLPSLWRAFQLGPQIAQVFVLEFGIGLGAAPTLSATGLL